MTAKHAKLLANVHLDARILETSLLLKIVHGFRAFTHQIPGYWAVTFGSQ